MPQSYMRSDLNKNEINNNQFDVARHISNQKPTGYASNANLRKVEDPKKKAQPRPKSGVHPTRAAGREIVHGRLGSQDRVDSAKKQAYTPAQNKPKDAKKVKEAAPKLDAKDGRFKKRQEHPVITPQK